MMHDDPAATGRRPLRPSLRARRVRRRARRAARQRARRTRSSRRACRRSRTSSTAAPRAPTSRTGDGAGILVADARRVLPRASSTSSCPPAGHYGVAVCFLPRDPARRAQARGAARAQRPRRGPARPRLARRAGRRRRTSATTANAHAPAHPPALRRAGAGLRRRPGRLRAQALRHPPHRRARRRARTSTSPSFSSRTIVYKGMLIPHQLARLLPRPAATSASRARMALVHSRFSTNTFPSWELAHPYRVIAHNGEINTLMGNVNWMRARESQLAIRAVRPRPRRRSCRSSAPAARTRRRSTTCSSC